MQIKHQQSPQGLSLDLPVTFLQEGKSVIAYTPALDLSTAGKDIAEAKKRFIEVVHIFVNDLVENNTLESVLLGLGWTRESTSTSLA